MTAQRERKWMSLKGLIGGLAMFATEAAVVLTLAAVAWLISMVFLAVL